MTRLRDDKIFFLLLDLHIVIRVQLQKGSLPCRVVNSRFKAKFSSRSPSWYLKLPIINVYRCLQEMGDRLWKYRFTHDCLRVDGSFKRPVKVYMRLQTYCEHGLWRSLQSKLFLRQFIQPKLQLELWNPVWKTLVSDAFGLCGPWCLPWNTLKVFSSGFKFPKETTLSRGGGTYGKFGRGVLLRPLMWRASLLIKGKLALKKPLQKTEFKVDVNRQS